MTLLEEYKDPTLYPWDDPAFVAKVITRMFVWFKEDEDRYFYLTFPREEMGIGHRYFMERMEEHPDLWTEAKQELDLTTSERLLMQGLKKRVNAQVVVFALRHLGEQWKDTEEVNVTFRSIADQIEQAHKELKEGVDFTVESTPTRPPLVIPHLVPPRKRGQEENNGTT